MHEVLRLRLRQMLTDPQKIEEALASLRQRFEAFAQGFAPEGHLPYPLELKRRHSARVGRCALRIAQDLGWEGWDRAAAEGGGWLHDVGRFPQFARFQTFQDHRSLDHGEAGWGLLDTEPFLDGWPPEERCRMASAVRYHNKRHIPDACPEEHLSLVRLVRDADKLDVFQVVQDAIDEGRIGEILSGVSLDPAPSPEFLAELQRGTTSVAYRPVYSLTDFLLLQLLWIYDMNYPISFRLLSASGVLDRLLSRLPELPQVRDMAERCLRHVARRAEGLPEPLAPVSPLPYA